ncbi:MAG TPA: hypothetical protein VJZ68_03600 [Nitrososphaera sp.]|nr:hypothetical protein [Nitrososphaera sp.]
MKVADYDKYGINKFYQNYMLNVKPEEFLDRCTEESELADIIHIHSRIDVLFRLREKFGGSKKIVLHYHGTDIRGLDKRKDRATQRLSLSSMIHTSKRKIATKILSFYLTRARQNQVHAQKLANAVIVSTPDLLQLVPKASYLPNPIDTDHFRPDPSPKNQRKEALTMDTEVTDIKWALNYCRKNNIGLDIEVYRRMVAPIMYADMPQFLKRYKVYVDIRHVDKSILQNLSKTALEALACGLDVLDYQLKYHKGLPSEHDPVNVVSRLSSIYLKAATPNSF